MNNPKKPLMLVLSSPSGAGKTTLSKKIQQSDNSFEISVSHTTRKPRPNEVDGLDYHFVTKKNFELLLKQNAFYEHAEIFGNYYGTSKSSINQITKKNNNVLFDIDWQGSEQLSKFKQLNLVKVFILPPNKEELEKRLIARNQDDKDAIKKRMLAYSKDVVHQKDYDYVLINDNVDDCFNKLKKIISKHLQI
ncbi:MAG: guanylate kinase [Pelagibacteraceae bacterium TMED124]|nr:MAG: guanylate kinase [Pelagibacteraceae bacterium TMED124]|tara:strand:+ start:1880 stop:2455 length:576 start_codon:yes stop_codon:yes gene_type:complete